MFDVDRLLVAASAWWLLVVVCQNAILRSAAARAEARGVALAYIACLIVRPFLLILATGEAGGAALLVWRHEPRSWWWLAVVVVVAGICGVLNVICLFRTPGTARVAINLYIRPPQDWSDSLWIMLAGFAYGVTSSQLVDLPAASALSVCLGASYFILMRGYVAQQNMALVLCRQLGERP